MLGRQFTSQRGNVYVEYAVATAILVAAFSVAATYLYEAANNRADSSMNATSGVHGMAPCYLKNGNNKGTLDLIYEECR
jgi:uncharacterized protein (UPF0333 family)